MISKWKWISLGVFLSLFILLTACDVPLLKLENTLNKEDADLPSLISAAEESLEDVPGKKEPRSQDMITITLVFDNHPYKPGLETAWGFSAFITYQDQNVLFDTGAAGNLLLNNMAALDIKPAQIQNVVLSHEHADHTGGMQSLVSAGADPRVYLPPSFSSEFKDYYSRLVDVIEVSPGMKIIDRIYTIGEMDGPPPEQALVIDTTKGLVVITGCAHPGIGDIVRRAKQKFEKEIYLVLGGFHLGNANAYQVDEIIEEFNLLGVKYVAPCHCTSKHSSAPCNCTGEESISQFREAFGEDFIEVGVGKVFEIEN